MPLIRLPPLICQIIRVVDDLQYDAQISLLCAHGQSQES